jgi:hypothetical protein
MNMKGSIRSLSVFEDVFAMGDSKGNIAVGPALALSSPYSHPEVCFARRTRPFIH